MPPALAGGYEQRRASALAVMKKQICFVENYESQFPVAEL